MLIFSMAIWSRIVAMISSITHMREIGDLDEELSKLELDAAARRKLGMAHLERERERLMEEKGLSADEDLCQSK